MPVRQDTLRRRWLAANNYAATTERTYTETLIGFERRFPIYVNRVAHEHLVDYLTTDADGQATSRAPSIARPSGCECPRHHRSSLAPSYRRSMNQPRLAHN